VECRRLWGFGLEGICAREPWIKLKKKGGGGIFGEVIEAFTPTPKALSLMFAFDCTPLALRRIIVTSECSVSGATSRNSRLLTFGYPHNPDYLLNNLYTRSNQQNAT